jgi:hypothetical protein
VRRVSLQQGRPTATRVPLNTASTDRNVRGYLGKAAAALHPGDPQAAREQADGQRLRVLHGRAKAVAATLAPAAAKARAKNSRLDLTDVDKAVTYRSGRPAIYPVCPVPGSALGQLAMAGRAPADASGIAELDPDRDGTVGN